MLPPYLHDNRALQYTNIYLLKKNVFLEIRAGAGGDEAALFVADVFRMYSRYAEQARWKIEIMSSSDGTAGGYKDDPTLE